MDHFDIDSRLPKLAALRGSDLGVSEWKRITQEDIDAFSELTGDGGPIHNDPALAAEISPFGGTIVQGFYMLSCLTGFAKGVRLPQEGITFRLNYGFDKVRIIAPVVTGSRIRGRFKLNEVVSRGSSAAVLTMDATVEVEGSDNPALVAQWLAYLQLEDQE